MTYAEKLKSPLWQRKRLEVLQRENFTCEQCGSKDQTLHVHHCYYEKSMMPWDYPDFALKCLCKDCHADRQDIELSIQKVLSSMSYEDLGMIHCDVLYAVAMHGLSKVMEKCKELET